jgi:uncharacterized protein with HEPN domain
VPPRQRRLFVADILDAIAAIDDRLRLDAVIKNLAVIGEAAGRVPADLTETNPQIPWSRMRGMRNVVVHEYFGIDNDVLWGTVTDDLKPLVPLLTALLAELSGDG